MQVIFLHERLINPADMITTFELTKKFGEFTALDHLTLEVNPGEIFCLLGANGAGKSTTIGLLLDFIKPSSGKALIGGIDVVERPLDVKRLVSYIPENLMLYPKLSGLENLDFFCRLSGKKYDKAALLHFLEEAGLPVIFASKRVEVYSKGMRQKVVIALTLAKDARVLLLDEPTSGLDPKSSNEFGELLQRMSEKKVAVLMATHDLFRARQTATHVGIMREGRLLETMPVSQLSGIDLEELYLSHMN